MRSRRAALTAGVVAGVAMLSSACSDRTEGDTFVIGYVAPFSSDEAGAFDRVALAGAQYEAARLNARNGIGGRPIEIIEYDLGDDPAAAGDGARTLIDHGAEVLFAAPFVEYAAGVVDAGAAAGVPVLSVTGTIPAIVSDRPDTAFLTAFGDNVQAAVAAQVAIDSGARTALLVSTGDIAGYGDTLPVYFAEAFTRRGGEVAAMVDVDLDEAPGFEDVLDALDALPAPPDLVYTAIYSPWLNDLLVALRAHGYEGAVYGADGAETDELLAAGGVAEGMIVTSHAFTGSHATVGLLFSPRSPAERIAQFVEGFERFHGEPPSSVSFAALGADAVDIVHAAAERADGNEPSAIASAIADLDRVQVTTGRVTYRGNGSIPVKVVYVLEVRDGAFRLREVVEPSDVPDPIVAASLPGR
jgi:branched-chain amino acid transport system substrate-binding protein